jgi:uncharacterized protein
VSTTDRSTARHELDEVLDGAGRRGEIDRRKFLRMGVVGSAVASAAIMGKNPAKAHELLEENLRLGKVTAAGLVEAGPELALPPGFTYKTFGRFGSAMTDGFITPPLHDGMGTFDGPEAGTYRIVRNHELGEGNDIGPHTPIGLPRFAYDRRAPGGCTTMTVDDGGNLLESFISINGTDTNCAGMPTPWGTWITCEETVTGTGSGRRKPHGYVFEVDASANELRTYEPLKDMGRFLHEAGAVDDETGVVYMTEDEGPDGFYRYVPRDAGNLPAGGRLQMLRVKGHPRYNTIVGQTVGDVLECDWVGIDDPDPAGAEDDASNVFHQGRAKGGAKFLGGEGCTFRDPGVVFDSSDGGDEGLGQIWQYTPTSRRGFADEGGQLELLYESGGRAKLDGPDNLCTSPAGAIVIAEDGAPKTNFVRVLLPDGSIFPLAENLVAMQVVLIDAMGKVYDPEVPFDDFTYSDGIGYSEFAGPRFSPDGKWLFVNIQVPGITCAITGNWASLGM